ncbi:DUF4157 domain-containing protein [Caproicibacter sp.]|uniref:eCIS core domain-containing protein n=1 Tax=Caproicibacter sp. TaxID=2814884 RepID=UPI0039890C20
MELALKESVKKPDGTAAGRSSLRAPAAGNPVRRPAAARSFLQLRPEDGENGRSEERPRPNRTGLPDTLKTSLENRTGLSLDEVRVHYNSSRPARYGALAFAKGTEIHVAPGQEKSLPHEAWHVVQQMQGRVTPNARINGEAANTDSRLEREAEAFYIGGSSNPSSTLNNKAAGTVVIQFNLNEAINYLLKQCTANSSLKEKLLKFFKDNKIDIGKNTDINDKKVIEALKLFLKASSDKKKDTEGKKNGMKLVEMLAPFTICKEFCTKFNAHRRFYKLTPPPSQVVHEIRPNPKQIPLNRNISNLDMSGDTSFKDSTDYLCNMRHFRKEMKSGHIDKNKDESYPQRTCLMGIYNIILYYSFRHNTVLARTESTSANQPLSWVKVAKRLDDDPELKDISVKQIIQSMLKQLFESPAVPELYSETHALATAIIGCDFTNGFRGQQFFAKLLGLWLEKNTKKLTFYTFFTKYYFPGLPNHKRYVTAVNEILDDTAKSDDDKIRDICEKLQNGGEVGKKLAVILAKNKQTMKDFLIELKEPKSQPSPVSPLPPPMAPQQTPPEALAAAGPAVPPPVGTDMAPQEKRPEAPQFSPSLPVDEISEPNAKKAKVDSPQVTVGPKTFRMLAPSFSPSTSLSGKDAADMAPHQNLPEPLADFAVEPFSDDEDSEMEDAQTSASADKSTASEEPEKPKKRVEGGSDTDTEDDEEPQG